jgi:hypothetical protein
MNWTEPEQEILRYAYDFYVNFHGGTSIRRPSLRRLFRSLDGEMAACWRPTRITPKAAAQMRAGDFSDASMQGLHRDHHQPLARMIYALLDRAEPAGFEEWCQVWWDTGSDGSRSYDLDACLSIPWDRSWTPAGIKSLPRSKAARAAYQEALAC